MHGRSRLSTIDHHQHHHESDEESEEIKDTFPAFIFDAAYCGESVPSGFDAVRIAFDGGIRADLLWKRVREAALAYTAQGFRIFWEIDLGISTTLLNPLSNSTQFLALSLSLKHFCDSLWKEFRQDTVGLCLYRGTLDFSKEYGWDNEQLHNLQEWLKDLFLDAKTFAKETQIDVIDFTSLTLEKMSSNEYGQDLLKLFCSNVMGEYLSLLAANISDYLPLFLLFNSIDIKNSFLIAQLLNHERYPRFHLAVQKEQNETQVLGEKISWNGIPMENGLISRTLNTHLISERPKIGLSLPSLRYCRHSLTAALNHALALLQKEKISFRVISEVELTAEWDGLDYLIVDSKRNEQQFKRKLQGFCAAGGTVVVIGSSLGLAQEMPFEAFLLCHSVEGEKRLSS